MFVMQALKERILGVFPTPNFLALPTAGVDVSDRSVKWIEIRGSGESNIIYRYGEHPLPEGVILNGLVVDRDAFVRELRSVKEKSGLTNIVTGLPEEHAYTARMRLSRVPEKNMRESVLFSLDQYVPLSPSEVCFDYIMLKQKDDDAENCELITSVIPRQISESYEISFVEAGFVPIAFEVESQATARAAVPYGEKIVAMVLDIGESRSGVSIVCNGEVWFSSTIAQGGKEVERLYAEIFHVEREEAKREKNENGFIVSRGEKGESRAIALASLYSPICDELVKQIDYWNVSGRLKFKKGDSDDHHDGTISTLFVCGGEGNVPGLVGYLNKRLGISVEKANPWQNVLSFEDTIPLIEREDALRYTTAIGLALRSPLVRHWNPHD
jgi:type IV pilus assembly protein PilM